MSVIPTKEFKPRLRLQPKPWTELRDDQGEPLIEDLLDRGDLSIIYGPSGCGKTFLALDIGMHIALGQPWRNLETARADVIYIAAESAKSIKRRVQAFHIHHGIDPDKTAQSFRVIDSTVNLLDPDADLDDLILGCKAEGRAPGMVIIDTVSRVLAGGDENLSSDMGAFVINLDRLRTETGAHICGIHHTGKDTARGARGWSGLRAAVDTEIEVSNEYGIVTAAVTKQRDYAQDKAFAFKIEVLEIDQRANGKPITSCALIPIEAVTKQTGLKLTKDEQTFLTVLHEAGPTGLTVDEWNEKARKIGLATKRRQSLYDWRMKLKGHGLVHTTNGRWYVTKR